MKVSVSRSFDQVSLQIVLAFLWALIYASCNAEALKVTFAFSATTLLSGSLTSCRPNATVSSCAGGLAALLAFGRNLTSTGFSEHIVYVPEIDVSSPFVQMHPLGFAVNLEILKHVGIDTYFCKPSLFSSRISNNYAGLFNDSVQAIMTNTDMYSNDEWADYIRRRAIYTFGNVRVGLLYITPSQQQFSIDAVPALRPAIRNLRRSADVVIVLYQDRVMTGAEALDVLALTGELPDVLIDIGSKTAPTSIAPVTYNSTKVVWSGTAQIESFGVYVTMNIDDVTKSMGSAGLLRTTLASLPSSLKDQEYFDFQEYLSHFSSAASTNDPVLSHTLVDVSKSRVDGYYPCFAGECVQGTIVARALAWAFDADVAMLNSGGPRGPGWPAGPIKTSDVWAFQTFANTPCRAKLMGLKVWELMNASMAYLSFSAERSTFGDRFTQTYGLQIDYDNSTAATLAGTRIRAIRVLDRQTNTYKPLERLKYYTVVSDTYQCTGMPVASQIIQNMRYGEEVISMYSDEISQITTQRFLLAHDPYQPVLQNYLQWVVPTQTDAAFMNWAQNPSTCANTERWDSNLASCMPCPAGQRRDPDDSSRCSVVPLDNSTNNTTLLVAVLVPVCVILSLLAVLSVICFARSSANARNNKHAPKGETAAIIFTDIQMSTKLWGTVPASMAAALDQHHALIRQAIAEHQAYEVKTVGDSFMIAVETAQQAVDLAMQIETDFMKAPWPRCIDLAYAAETDKGILDFIDDNPEDVTLEGFEFDPLEPKLEPTGHASRRGVVTIMDQSAKLEEGSDNKKLALGPSISKHFHGTRVRIGIHFGPVDAVLDEVSKGYDYYGNTVNIAARLESAADGGQIIISREVANKIKMNDGEFRVQLLGETQLKGVIGVTELLQLSPLPLINRIFTAKTLEKINDQQQTEAEKHSDSSKMSKISATQSTFDGGLNERDTGIRESLVRAFRPLKPELRTKQIDQLAKAWRIQTSKGKKTSEAEKFDIILGIIAKRIGSSLPVRYVAPSKFLTSNRLSIDGQMSGGLLSDKNTQDGSNLVKRIVSPSESQHVPPHQTDSALKVFEDF